MRNKTNRVVSLAMSAALMLTNMISPITAFAEDVSEPMTDAYMDAPADDVPEETPETEPPYYTITLPWYEDVVYMAFYDTRRMRRLNLLLLLMRMSL